MKLVGNGKTATILIFVFIAIICGLTWRCSHAAEAVLRGGTSFGGRNSQGPVLGLDLRFPQGNNLDLYAGTLLWGATRNVDTNWDWHVGFRACRWRVCANLGATYLQKTDYLDGSHTNFNLGLSFLIGAWRVESIDYFHISNAGTVLPNYGRNAVLADFKLQ